MIGSTSSVVERAIEVEDIGSVGVRADEFDRLVVRWFCGDKRSFSAEDLQQTIDDLELLEDYPDVWLELADSNGRPFVARLVDGDLQANQMPVGDAGRVPWRALKKTLRKMG